MKRALTLALTVALIGGLAFMGIAGTAAAQDGGDEIDVLNPEVDNDQDSEATTEISVDQDNDNEQNQVTVASSSSDTSYAKASSYQQQDVDQDNDADVEDVTTVSSNYAENDAENEIELDFRIGPPGQIFDSNS